MTAIDPYPMSYPTSPAEFRRRHPTVILHPGGARRPDHPDPIYPHRPTRHCPVCMSCWQRHDDLAWCPTGDGLIYLCPACYRAQATGQPPILPTGEQLADTWRRIARMHHNHEITGTDRDRALISLAGHLPLADGREAVDALADAMLRLQEADDPMFDLATLEPEWRDAEVYETHLQGLADDAVATLMGPRR